MPALLKLESRAEEGCVVLKATGELNERNAHELAAAIKAAVGTADISLVILDVDGLNYLSSVGLGVLVNEHRCAAAAGRRLVLAGVNPKARGLFSVSSLDKVISIFDSVREALALRDRPFVPKRGNGMGN